MSRKTMTQSSDSQESNPLYINPRQERKYTLTTLGYKAVDWIKEQELKADEFAFVCPGCSKPLGVCRCKLSK